MKIILATALVLLFTSCAHKSEFKAEMLEIKKAQISYDGRILNQDKLEEDIDFTIWALQHAYAGSKYLPGSQFVNLTTQLNQIKKSPSLSRQQFARALQRAFDSVDDAHLGVSAPQIEESVSARKPSVGANIFSGKPSPYFTETVKVNNKTVGLISITKFPSSVDPIWGDFSADIKKIWQVSEALILDLRGNGGGDDTRGFELASLLYGQKSPSFRVIVTRLTPEALTIYRNTYFLKIENMKFQVGKIPEEWTRTYAKLTTVIQDAKAGKVPDEETRSKSNAVLDKSKIPKKKIYILQDAGCASSCESLLEALENHPYATTVGENTMGLIHFGDVSPFQLPNSAIRISAPIKYFKFPDNRFLEKKGYAPKIQLQPGQDAFDYVINLIKNEK